LRQRHSKEAPTEEFYYYRSSQVPQAERLWKVHPVVKASRSKGSLRSKRKRAALDQRFREGITNLIFQTFGA